MRNLASTVASAARRFAADDTGQDLLEYGLLASLIATFLIGTLGLFGQQLNVLWTTIASAKF
jgi:Flp pilus assembly pilin Flp